MSIRTDPMSMFGRTPGRKRFAAAVAVIATTAFLLRLAYAIRLRSTELSGDGLYYSALGNLLAEGKGFVSAVLLDEGRTAPTAFHPPAWSLLLGLASRLGLTTTLQHQLVAFAVGTAMVVAVAYAGRRVAGPRVGLIAATIVASPVFAAREWELLAEPLAMTGVAIVLLLSYRFLDEPGTGEVASIGGVIGVLILTRPDLALLIPFLLVPLVTSRSVYPWRTRLSWLAVGTIVALLLVAPWVVFNNLRFRELVLLSTQLGPTLVEANCETTYYGDRLGFGDGECRRAVPENRIEERGDESTRDLAMRDVAATYIGEHLGRLPLVVLVREGRAWGAFRPAQQARFESDRGTPYRYVQIATVIHWALFAAAALGVIRLRRLRVVVFPMFAVIATASVAVAVAFGSTRYRAVADVPIAILAGAGIERTVTLVFSAVHRRHMRTSRANEMVG